MCVAPVTPEPLLRQSASAAVADRRIPTDGSGGLESKAGISRMDGVLVAMIFYGKLFAIVCLCVWVYFVPWLGRIPAADQSMAVDHGRRRLSSDEQVVDLDSEAYKKRVVMQGFPERRNTREGRRTERR